MALHFEQDEFDARKAHVLEEMARRKIDALLMFAPESHYWLSGYDTFGYCFFQCLVLTRDGKLTLLTRSADLRQARHTSLITEIVVWADQMNASPALQLRELLDDLDLLGSRIGIEYDTHGLTAANGRAMDDTLKSFGDIEDASDLVRRLRAVKSPAEIAYVRRAAELADDALDAGLAAIGPGADEGAVLAAMQDVIFRGGGDYPANPFVIGSGRDALLCRTKTGRRKLDEIDQITLEFAGTFRLYHAALMRTVVVGVPSERHRELHAAAAEALAACEAVMQPGRTFGEVYTAHAEALDAHGLARHRLNACGYSLGARYAPSWMDWPMFYRDNEVTIAPNMVLFAHMILMDSDTETAMCLGRTYLTTEGAPESLSRHGLELIVR
ncbi:M24 family metallopeptidase [Propylenella binzhouense]|uniref:Aminopeptidase P family protein n=1 Tax=Propylenella binzhouense TaxID=2555902 RepID=A0A964WUB3_9HYPH|nr:Xaa-Pro peptidase family protein [Propylenella binzhouense]MYZ48858.1 aminopeptidase P family protein [Propylenella binzhouense]